MTSVKELRELAIAARRENSNERHTRYVRAREEAFEVLTDGKMEEIATAASKGRFRYPIYRWTNQSRGQTTETTTTETTTDDNDGTTGVPEATQLYFGNDESGKNGLHIMALMQPTGIPYEDTLVAKLREHFISKFPSGEEGAEDTNPKRTQLKVFLQRRPTNPRQCAIFVSWENDRHVTAHRRPFVQRPQTSPTDGTATTPSRPVRGTPPFRGAPTFRGGPTRGRGRTTTSTPRQ